MSIRPRFRGDNQPMIWTLSVSSNGSQTPVDLTNATTTMTIKKTNELISLVGINEDAPNGVVKFSPTEATFDEVGTFAFDISVDYGNGIKTTFVKDTIIIKDDINKQ